MRLSRPLRAANSVSVTLRGFRVGKVSSDSCSFGSVAAGRTKNQGRSARHACLGRSRAYRVGELTGWGTAALIDQSPDRPIAVATRRASLRVSNNMAWSSSPQRGGSGEISHTGSLSRCCLITYMARPGILFGSCRAIAKSSPKLGAYCGAWGKREKLGHVPVAPHPLSPSPQARTTPCGSASAETRPAVDEAEEKPTASAGKR